MKRVFMALMVSSIALTWGLARGGEKAGEKVWSYAREIVEMRSRLAKEFVKPDMEITEETFRQVCGAVGKRVKEISEKEGFKIRHAAVKYRNPANAATEEEAGLIDYFDKRRDVDAMSDTVKEGGKTYGRNILPIFVEEACLACHGPKETRPAWIVEKYPDDRAYDFKVGDIRGIISVAFPMETE